MHLIKENHKLYTMSFQCLLKIANIFVTKQINSPKPLSHNNHFGCHFCFFSEIHFLDICLIQMQQHGNRIKRFHNQQLLL